MTLASEVMPAVAPSVRCYEVGWIVIRSVLVIVMNIEATTSSLSVKPHWLITEVAGPWFRRVVHEKDVDTAT